MNEDHQPAAEPAAEPAEEPEVIVAYDSEGKPHEFPREQYRDRRSGYGIDIQDGKVLMVKDAHSHKWELPGGAGTSGISPEEAMHTEFHDETGLDIIGEVKSVITIREYYYDTRLPFPYRHDRRFFLVSGVDGTIKEAGNGYDIEQAAYIPLTDLPSLDATDTIKKAIAAAQTLTA